MALPTLIETHNSTSHGRVQGIYRILASSGASDDLISISALDQCIRDLINFWINSAGLTREAVHGSIGLAGRCLLTCISSDSARILP